MKVLQLYLFSVEGSLIQSPLSIYYINSYVKSHNYPLCKIEPTILSSTLNSDDLKVFPTTPLIELYTSCSVRSA